MMKKTLYAAPEMELLSFASEQGFAASQDNTVSNITPWTEDAGDEIYF